MEMPRVSVGLFLKKFTVTSALIGVMWGHHRGSHVRCCTRSVQA